MSSFFRATILVIILVLGSCSSRNYSAPSNLDDACSIVRQYPHYKRAMEMSERKWGLPVHVQMATIYQESKFVGNARTRKEYTFGFIPKGRVSSAYGYAQALDGTWDEYRDKTGNWSGRRNNIYDAADFIGWYMSETRRRAGVSLNNAEHQYLAYHEGQGGYMRGSHKSKSWLLRVASEVGNRSSMYKRQLSRCS
ncbi:MAG: lytic transglycosylase [Paracoccaceae bacterium]|nr:lytic transglycosylase [Paracoccaceae bacterium]MDG2260153.1 lytic transglycosylase [Paracoccaceae bacterium]